MPKRRTGPDKRIAAWGARALLALLRRLPVTFAWRLGRGVGWLAWRTMAVRRDMVREHLAIVDAWRRGDGSPQDVDDACVREVFLRAGGNMLAGFPFMRLSTVAMERHVRVENIEALSDAIGRGRGVILLLAHMGPWEILTVLPRVFANERAGASYGALYRPLDNAYLDAWIREERERAGTRLFSRREGFHATADFLRAGGVLGVLADQRVGHGVEATFFGQPAKTSPLPGLLQRRTGAAMVALSMETTGPAQWRLEFAGVDLSGTDRSTGRAEFAEVCNRALEDRLSRSVEDGFWFHDRWRQRGRRAG